MTGVWLAALRWGPATVSIRREGKELGPLGGSSGSPARSGVCSCLENPRDWGPWWAAISGVPQSRTRLMRLSSSSSSKLRLMYIQLQILAAAAAAAKSLQSCPTLWDPREGSPPGSPLLGILRARTLECPQTQRHTTLSGLSSPD